MQQGLCSNLTHLWATLDFVPPLRSIGDGRGYVATRATCGPSLILPSALKHWGPPRQQGLCSHVSNLWATSDFVPCCEVFRTRQAAGVI